MELKKVFYKSIRLVSIATVPVYLFPHHSKHKTANLTFVCVVQMVSTMKTLLNAFVVVRLYRGSAGTRYSTLNACGSDGFTGHPKQKKCIVNSITNQLLSSSPIELLASSSLLK